MKGLMIISNYNQVHEIEKLLGRVKLYHPPEHCVVVDDGSTDGSPAIAERLGFRVVYHQKNRGVGAAIRTGLRDAIARGYDYVSLSSSNGKIRPEDLKTVVGPILDGSADYTTGSRFMKGGGSPGLTPFRRAMIPVFSTFCAVLLGRYFSDITCGYRAYKLDWLKDPRVNLDQDWLDRYEMEYYLHWWAYHLGLRMVEVPVTIQYTHLKKGRISKIRPFVGWWQMIRPFVLMRFGLKH